MEYKDPGRSIPIIIPTIFLGFPIWGSLFRVPLILEVPGLRMQRQLFEALNPQALGPHTLRPPTLIPTSRILKPKRYGLGPEPSN